MGFGLFVDVAGGGLFGFEVAVRKKNGVFEAVGERVGEGVSVGLADGVGVIVDVGINSENASKVSATPEFSLENAKFTTSPGFMAMGSCNVGSDNAIADAPQNKPKPRVLAAKIHRSPA